MSTYDHELNQVVENCKSYLIFVAQPKPERQSMLHLASSNAPTKKNDLHSFSVRERVILEAEGGNTCGLNSRGTTA